MTRGSAQAQKAASALAERAVMEMRTLWPDLEGLDSVLMRERIMGILPDLVKPHREAAMAVAADWYMAARPASAPEMFEPILAEEAGDGLLRRLVGDALDPIFQSGEDKNYVQAQEQIEGVIEDVVLRGFRDTVAFSSSADPACEAWERTLSPGACDYCAEKAGELYYTEGQYESHPHCRCTNEPVFYDYPGDGHPDDNEPTAEDVALAWAEMLDLVDQL